MPVNIQTTAGSQPRAAEMRAHWSDLRASFGRLRQWRAPWSLVVVLLLVTFVAGTILGVASGTDNGFRLGKMMAAGGQQFIDLKEAKGSSQYREISAARAFDNWVSEVAAKPRMSWWWIREADQRLRRLFSDSKQSQLSADWEWQHARSIAEHRLKYSKPVQADTLAELHKRGIEIKNTQAAQWHEYAARNYSILLGREIRAEQLVLDAEMREEISQDDARRASQAIK